MNRKFAMVATLVTVVSLGAGMQISSQAKRSSVPGAISNCQAKLANGTIVRFTAAASVINGTVTGMTSINYPTWSYSGNHNRIVFKDARSVTLYSAGTLLPSRKPATAEYSFSTATGLPISFKIMQSNAVAGQSGAANSVLLPFKGGHTIVAP